VFGKRSIFRDIEDIPAGNDFRKVLSDAVNESNIMLVMIGPQWASITDNDSNKRLFNTNDFVRFEVESGLKKRDMTVIPVLLLNTNMPESEELPGELLELLYRNAAVVRDDPDFTTDIERLINQIRRIRPVETVLRWSIYILPVVLLTSLAIFAIRRIYPTNIPTSNQPMSSPDASVPLNGSASQPSPGSVSMIKDGIAKKSFSLYEEPDIDSLALARPSKGDLITVLEANPDGTWHKLRLPDGMEGWGLTEDIQILDSIKVGAGYGIRGDFWDVYFTAPLDNPHPESHLGIDARLAATIDWAKTSIDMAMAEMNNKVLVEALIQAFEKGVKVRIVTDNRTGYEAGQKQEYSFPDLLNAGIPIVTDKGSGVMHDKFIIIDEKTVWTGSYNLTNTSNYDQNNNALMFNSTDIAHLYEKEFNEMFEQHQFGRQSPPSETNKLIVNNLDVEIYFLPEDLPFPRILELIASAKKSIRVMALIFSDEEIASEIIAASKRGVRVDGIVEKTFEERGKVGPLYCAGLDFRIDGNPKYLHHKVIIIDDNIVITGSANFSLQGATVNDENMVIVHDSDLASAYNLEFDRMLDYATLPTNVKCSQ
jgi:phosphatidylserine/phosphatidylglycerophosphate/cardiolipin synthase-like enzyme